MSHDEYAVEPIPGLPERPPAGEALIWQGAPNWRSLAVHAFHIRKIALYFAVVWVLLAALSVSGGQYGEILQDTGLLLAAAVLAIAVLSFMAWCYARATVYSITSERVVIRSGIALPITVNVPFSRIESAACRPHSDGTADVPMRVEKGQNASFVILWPNVKPWAFSRPEPMLRCVGEGERAAQVLAQALSDYSEPASMAPAIESRDEPRRRPREQENRHQAMA